MADERWQLKGADYYNGITDGIEWSSLNQKVRDSRHEKRESLFWVAVAVVILVANLVDNDKGLPELVAAVIWLIVLVVSLLRARRHAKAEDEAAADVARWLADHPELAKWEDASDG